MITVCLCYRAIVPKPCLGRRRLYVCVALYINVSFVQNSICIRWLIGGRQSNQRECERGTTTNGKGPRVQRAMNSTAGKPGRRKETGIYYISLFLLFTLCFRSRRFCSKCSALVYWLKSSSLMYISGMSLWKHSSPNIENRRIDGVLCERYGGLMI